MSVSAIALACCITRGTSIYALSACRGAFVVRYSLGVLGGIGTLAIAADALID